jgi:hypothetical protein
MTVNDSGTHQLTSDSAPRELAGDFRVDQDELARHAPVCEKCGLAARVRLEPVVTSSFEISRVGLGSMPMAQAGESLAGNDSQDASPTRSTCSSSGEDRGSASGSFALILI